MTSPSSSLRGDGAKRVVVASPTARLGRSRLSPLVNAGFDIVERYDLLQGANEETLSAALQGAWGVIAANQTFTRRVLEEASELRVIARTGVGTDGIDVAAATECGIAVFTTPGLNQDSVADHTIALMLACLRRVAAYDALVRSGQWRGDFGVAPDLYRATVGVVGLGRIGRAVARRLTGFDCRIMACEPNPDLEFCSQLRIELRSLARILPEVDVLTIHVPLTLSTHHFIGIEQFALMRREAILVNTSRGAAVDESALIQALASGDIAGAGLDVFEHEPLAENSPLTTMRNVVLTPHCSSFARSAVNGATDAVVAGLMCWAGDTTPAGCVNPDVLSHSSSNR